MASFFTGPRDERPEKFAAGRPTATLIAVRPGSRSIVSVTAAALLVALAAGGAFALAGDSDRAAELPAPAARPRRFVETLDVRAFHKGNLHAHSTESDGDVPPEAVYRWYRSRGYAFAALSDHNTRIDPAVYAHLERPGFKLLPAEEITMLGGGRQVHVNAVCTRTRIGGGTYGSKGEALGRAIAEIDAQGGVALVNHPNFDRSLSAEDLWAGRGAHLLEIWSGHPYVYSSGVDERPSHEVLWAELLTRGATFHGVAVDDAHVFASGKLPGKSALPGRGWIATYAEPGADVDRASTCDAIRRGRFYSSSGAAIARIAVSGSTVAVWPADPTATVLFLGPDGAVLDVDYGGADGARFTLRGEEAWVRARVEQPDGARAWTQAFRTATD
jgi:hypothetical protein